MGLSGAVVPATLTAQRSIDDFLSNGPIFIGEDAENHWGNVGVAWEGIAPQDIGLVHVGGATVAMISGAQADQWMDHADVSMSGSNTEMLELHPSGTWKVIWTDLAAGREQAWAVVLYRGSWQRELYGVMAEQIDWNGPPKKQDVILVKGQGSPGQIDTNFIYLDGVPSFISAGKQVISKWFPDELKWIIVAAECE